MTIPSMDARGAAVAMSCGVLAATLSMAALLRDRAAWTSSSAAILGAVAVLVAGMAAGGL